MKVMKVIIVEDEVRIREGLEKLLSKLNKDIEIVGEAENGELGLELLRNLKPDMVITDIMMPKMDGLEMLENMVAEGIQTRAVVLSAYSEFEYARKAMKLGVTEYLLKPISYNDFAQAVDNCILQIEKDRREKPARIGTIEQIISEIVDGRLEIDTEINTYLKNNYSITDTTPLAAAYVYLGNLFNDKAEETRDNLNHTLTLYPGIKYCIIEQLHRNSLVVVFYGYDSAKDLERWIQQQMMRSNSLYSSLGFVEVPSLGELEDGLNKLYPYMDWNITLGKDVLISYPAITKVQTVSCIYPIELETKMKVALCAAQWDNVDVLMSDFHTAFKDGNVYIPKEIKECYVRFLWAFIGIAKEIGRFNGDGFDQQKLLQMIMNAKTSGELETAAGYLIDAVRPKETDDEAMHLTVKRVRSMIHEFYSSGITLDEIADRLNVTPEYVGTLFHREMGQTFSNYMKSYRMNKAKELLCSTSLKLYEISERVGYTDPKYFSKVFKEVTGQLPNEYRKTYK